MTRTVVLDDRFGGLRDAFPAELELTPAPVIEGDLARLSALDDVVAIITVGNTPMPEPVFALPKLKLLVMLGSGFEAMDLERLNAKGVAVSHGFGVNAPDVATHAVAMFLAHNRRLTDGDRRVREGAFRDRSREAGIRSVAGLKVGIVGLGQIGAAIARRLEGFGCDLAWWGPREKPDEPLPRRRSLHELAQWSDVLFLAARADHTNVGLIDRAIIEAVGPRGLIVNISRGSLADEDALIAALREGRLGGAALDVFEQEPTPPERWRDVPNVLLTPHSGGIGHLARLDMARMAGETVLGFLADGTVRNLAAGSMPSTAVGPG
ncbi:MAG: 2-hydroxyacid dehydrogenase [Caulobacteraceae bacterium]|nr:2-hydroxyacid dehydrogenase [Caulobacteraceae bacterium]